MTRAPRKRAPRKRPGAPGGAGRQAGLLIGAVLSAYAGVLSAKWANTPVPTPEDIWPLLVFLGCAGVMGLVFLLARFTPEPRLLLPALFLYGVGVAVQFRFDMYDSAPPDALTRYTGAIGMALCTVVALATRGDTGRRLLHGLAPLAYLVALGVMAMMIVMGQRFRGGVFLAGGINPSEITKVMLVLAWASFLAARRQDLARTAVGLPAPPLRTALPLLVLWLLPMLALVYLRDFGMLVLCSTVLGIMLFGATGRTGYLVAGLLLTTLVTVAGYHLTPHIATRVNVWQTPFANPTGSGWQTLQALSAMYTGGAWGIGLGAGSPRQIPVASTDFVYAVIGEELGFAGCMLVLAAFLLLLRGAFDTAQGHGEGATRLMVIGLAALLAVQTILNLGGVTKSIPVTGVPLPFVSRGGSSLITSFLALGLLLGAASASPTRRRKK